MIRLTHNDAAHELKQIGEAIAAVGTRLDRVFDRLPSEVQQRVETIKGLETVNQFTGQALVLLAAEIDQQVAA